MTDFRILNGNPRATLLESFNGEVTVIGPGDQGLQRFKRSTVEEAVKSIEFQGWVVGVSHLHGPSGRHRKEQQDNA